MSRAILMLQALGVLVLGAGRRAPALPADNYAPPVSTGSVVTTDIRGTRVNPAWWKAYYEDAFVWAIDDKPVAKLKVHELRSQLARFRMFLKTYI